MITFRDISSYQAGMRIPPGTLALIAKASQGTYETDSCYAGFRKQAEAQGALFSPYHFLTDENPAAQAYHHWRTVGAGAPPSMVDVEPYGKSRPGVSHCLQFVEEFRKLGGNCWAHYFPEWYWNKVGGDLRLLQRAGLALISSNYSPIPAGAGWKAYGPPGTPGDVKPSVWQYTSARTDFAGYHTDDNAFLGSLTDLRRLMEGRTMISAEDVAAIADATAQKVWTLSGPDGDGGGPDAPDVHQSLDTVRDDVAELKATVARIAAKVGA